MSFSRELRLRELSASRHSLFIPPTRIFPPLKPYDQSPIDSILRLLHDVVTDLNNFTNQHFPLTSSGFPVLGAHNRKKLRYEKATILHHCVDSTSCRLR